MNKKIIMLAAVLMLSSLTACGEGGDKPVDTTQAVTASSTQSAESTAAQSSENKSSDTNSVEIPLTAMFPMVKLYIDGPSYQFIENGSTELYNVGGNRFIALTSTNNVKVNKPNEVLDAYLELFKAGVETNCNGSFPEKFNIKESKEIKINDIDFYRFQGELVLSNTGEIYRNGYAVGYTFIRNNIPFQVVGVVVSDEQKQEEIDEITTYVDAMVKTIRDKR